MRQELPIWTALTLPEHKGSDDTREYRPKKSRKHQAEHKPRIRLHLMGFLKRHGIALFLAAAFLLYGLGVSVITERRVTKRVTLKVQQEMWDGFQKYLEEQRQEKQAAGLLTGEASLQAAIDEMVEPIAVHVATLRMDRKVTVIGVKTYIWGVDLARLGSGKYGNSIQDVLEGNVEGYVYGHAVRNEDREIAREIVTAYMKGERPNGWTPDLEFAEINGDGSVTARNMLKTNSKTIFWRYPE